MTDELAFRSAVDLAALLRAGDVGSEELTRHYIGRIETSHATLNAVVVHDFERALVAARKADAARARGESLGPLHGLPMTAKESYDIAGLHTTWGVPDWRNHVADEDAHVVAALKAAGAHFVGKTNVPVMLGDFQSFNPIYGTTNNPWDVTRTPGGSSGGSAAALAAGLTGLEVGSDIGGSIRNPAHYCGVFGHKPTWGVVPMLGQKPPAVDVPSEVDLGVVGPLARSATDLKLVMNLVAGAPPLKQRGWKLALPGPRATSLKDLRVALWASEPATPVDDEVAERVALVGRLLADAGARVSETARPDIDLQLAYSTYVHLLQAVNNSGVPPEMFAANLDAARAFPAGDETSDAVMARAAVQYHNDWVLHDRNRTRLRMAWQRFYEDWDIVVCPVAPTAAFPQDQRPPNERSVTVNGEPRGYFELVFWAALATLPGLPGTVFPTGVSQAGLPIGLQAIGAEFDDHTTIDFARLMEQALGGFAPPPDYV